MPTEIEPTYVEPKSPPSSYAIAAAIEGEPGAWGRVFLVTAARAAFIAPGLWLGGVRGRQIATGSVMAAASITAMLFALYGLKRACAGDNTSQLGRTSRTLGRLL